jgi:hypothetical protein
MDLLNYSIERILLNEKPFIESAWCVGFCSVPDLDFFIFAFVLLLFMMLGQLRTCFDLTIVFAFVITLYMYVCVCRYQKCFKFGRGQAECVRNLNKILNFILDG